MKRAVIVIGSNYGDEGKGLAAAFSARRLGGTCLNILINGGAQRGHTVDLSDGRRHVFHHFGSASFSGAISCADPDFIVNPVLYMQESRALWDSFHLRPRLIVSDQCRVSLPWDMMLGQIIEENRGAARHGSCGCGIQETRLRFQNTDWALRFSRLARISKADFLAYCHRVIQDYLPERLRDLHMQANAEWQKVLTDENLLSRFWEDWQCMLAQTEVYSDWAKAAEPFDTLIFEAGQGLALDEKNEQDFPYLTPSRTTSLISARRIAALPGATDTEILYVTRAYLTRHGAGPLPTECPMEKINPEIIDFTNVYNPFQQGIRYGFFDGEAVLQRVTKDLAATRQVIPDAVSAVLVTHLNETEGRLAGDMQLPEFTASFDRAYLSDCAWNVYAA